MRIDPVLKEELKSYLLAKIRSNQKPRVLIRAPYLFSNEEVDKLKNRIELLENTEIDVKVDSSILAGFIIQFNSSVIDLSINSELQSLMHTLYETA